MLLRGEVLGGGVAPLENSSGKISKRGPREKSAEVYPPPPGKFLREKISKVKFNPPPPQILEILRVSPSWRQVVFLGYSHLKVQSHSIAMHLKEVIEN